ncbi:hypothetical protein ACQKND_16310 [Viridibacillus arvi]|uniref:hypothetical protein n=1 Tax=Viridibacillus arvi TaxID=263475 RepID=UPI003D0392CE
MSQNDLMTNSNFKINRQLKEQFNLITKIQNVNASALQRSWITNYVKEYKYLLEENKDNN